MQFRARFTGQLVLVNGPINNVRSVEKGQNLSLSTKAAERFARSLYGHVKAGRLVACDKESNELASLKDAPADVTLEAPPEEKEEEVPDMSLHPEPAFESQPEPEPVRKSRK